MPTYYVEVECSNYITYKVTANDAEHARELVDDYEADNDIIKFEGENNSIEGCTFTSIYNIDTGEEELNE